MLIRTSRGDAQINNAFEDTSRVRSWTEYVGGETWSGASVNLSSIGGLPAAAAAIRLISETIGMIPLLVYNGDPIERERARDSWQWRLLHRSPNIDQSPFDFKQDISTSIEGMGNAFLWKLKSRRRVDEAYVLDPSLIAVKREGGRKFFEVTIDGQTRRYTTDQIHHIRGWTISPGADVGLSPISYHRQALGSALGIHEFEGKFFRNNTHIGGAIQVPGDPDPETIDSWRRQLAENHAGLDNAWKPIVLKNNATWAATGLSMEDAQFISAKTYTVEEIARIFRISSPTMLGQVGQGTINQPAAEDFERFLKVDLAPRLARIEKSLMADPDLFDVDGDTFPEFLADAVLRPDAKTRYDAYRLARQGGWVSANEIRELENLPPKPGGDEIQETPVGGAPNQGANDVT